jgi:hypothetical protein
MLAAASALAGASLLSAGGAAGARVVAPHAPAPTWRVVNVTNTLTVGADVSCPTARACFVVGADDSSGRPLVHRWNGTRWTATASAPVPAGKSIGLQSVACVGVSWCVAVGVMTPFRGGRATTLVEAFDGQHWHVAATPDVAQLSNWLDAVSCTVKTNCMAVGYTTDSQQRDRPLALHLNATGWHIVAPPVPASPVYSSLYYGVACAPGSAMCMAVGQAEAPIHDGDRPLATRWDGQHWHATTAAAIADSSDYFNGVACPSALVCEAVGVASRKGGGAAPAVIERWNGTSWATESHPPAGRLWSVSCPSTTTCTAAGSSDASTVAEAPEILDRRAGTWSTAALPTVTTTAASYLTSVSCPSPTACVAAGAILHDPPTSDQLVILGRGAG